MELEGAVLEFRARDPRRNGAVAFSFMVYDAHKREMFRKIFQWIFKAISRNDLLVK